MNFKLGKLALRYNPLALRFADYRTAHIIDVPQNFGHYSLVNQWGMLANDQYGDCVWAGAAHETMMLNAEAGRKLMFTNGNVLADYHAVAGPGDNGTNVADAMKYRKSTGIIDATGHRHQIAAYLSLEPGNFDHVIEAAYLFGAVGIGIQVPSSAQDQFEAGKPWSVTHAPIEGGHYVPLVGRQGSYLDVVTWGRT